MHFSPTFIVGFILLSEKWKNLKFIRGGQFIPFLDFLLVSFSLWSLILTSCILTLCSSLYFTSSICNLVWYLLWIPSLFLDLLSLLIDYLWYPFTWLVELVSFALETDMYYLFYMYFSKQNIAAILIVLLLTICVGLPWWEVKKPPEIQETWVQSWFRKILWKREWHPTTTFLPEEFHGQRSLASYSPWVTMSQSQLSY